MLIITLPSYLLSSNCLYNRQTQQTQLYSLALQNQSFLHLHEDQNPHPPLILTTKKGKSRHPPPSAKYNLCQPAFRRTNRYPTTASLNGGPVTLFPNPHSFYKPKKNPSLLLPLLLSHSQGRAGRAYVDTMRVRTRAFFLLRNGLSNRSNGQTATTSPRRPARLLASLSLVWNASYSPIRCRICALSRVCQSLDFFSSSFSVYIYLYELSFRNFSLSPLTHRL